MIGAEGDAGMSVLRRLEATIERAVEGAARFVFRGPVSPAEIGQELLRAMGDSRGQGLAPDAVANRYTVRLAPGDLEALAPVADRLRHGFEGFLYGEMRGGGARMVSPPVVLLEADPEQPAGRATVAGEFVAGVARFTLADAAPGASEVPAAYTGRALLGRGPDCDLRLDVPQASRRHAAIEWTDEGFMLRDLGSANGTLVNGNLVTAALLTPGDVIGIGPARLRFEHLT